MTRLEYAATYAADLPTVLAGLLNEAFLTAYAREIGAVDWHVDVARQAGDARTTLRMTVPTKGVPAVFKRLVTPTVDITEVRDWVAVSAPGRQRGKVVVAAAVGSRSARVEGDLTLAPRGAETGFEVSAAVDVSVPFGKGLAAGLIKDLVTSVLNQQTKVMNRWTSGLDLGPPPRP